jgi:putative addiction module component (TIGR02574 family)
MSSLPPDIRDLSIVDRIELAVAIWDSVSEEGSFPSLTASQRAELDRRLESREQNLAAGDSWEAVQRRITEK